MSTLSSFFCLLLAIGSFLGCVIAIPNLPQPGQLGLFQDDSMELVQVVVLSRHGVRATYPSPDDRYNLSDYSPKTFPDWGVPPAQLTPHGGRLIEIMGNYYQQLYGRRLGLNISGCPQNITNSIYVYADNSKRDIQTAEFFMQGFVPTCNISINSKPPGVGDYLFNQGQLIFNQQCGLATEEQISGLIGTNGTQRLVELYHDQLTLINDVLDCCDPIVCQKGDEFNCTLLDIPIEWTGKFYEEFEGPFGVAGYFAEMFQMQYLNNMTFAFGELSLHQIIGFMEMHLTNFFYSENWWHARNFGSELLVHILASIDQKVEGKKIQGVEQNANTTFLYYAGHDVNLWYLRDLLNLNWLSAGWQRNQPAPGGMLTFEVYRNKNTNQYFVQVFFEIGTPDQLRHATPLTLESPPSRSLIAVPGCSGPELSCTWDEFKKIIATAVRPTCIENASLREYASKLVEEEESAFCEGSSLNIMFSLVSLVLGFSMIYH